MCFDLSVKGAGVAGGAPITIVPVDRHISDMEARSILAQCEAASGHFESARNQYRILLRSPGVSWPVRLSFAESCVLWGDYNTAENIYRDYLAKFPEDSDAAIRLAKAFSASQQFEYAEAVYRRLLLKAPEDAALLLGLAEIKRAQRNFHAALAIIDGVLHRNYLDPHALTAKGKILLRLGKLKDATETFIKLAEIPDYRSDGQLGLGRVLLKLGDRNAALREFNKVLDTDPENIEARFYQWFCVDGFSARGVPVSVPGELDTSELLKWSELCRVNGLVTHAVKCLERALEIDVDLFKARLELARVLAADRRFDRALTIFKELHEQLPESSMILLEWARTLSWARQYDESIGVYARIAEGNPSDPVPIIEMARVAVWAKRMGKARDYYGCLLDPEVDALLQEKLSDVFASSENGMFCELAKQVEEFEESGLPYDAYEWLFENTPSGVAGYADSNAQLESIRLDLLPVYSIQKAAYLERIEKWLTWRRRYLRALEACGNLVDFAPGNQEALYDLSQLQFALGLDREATDSTSGLFELDPSHNLAPVVLEKMSLTDNVYLLGDFSFWHEDGRGDLIDIKRYHYDVGAGLPFMGRGYVEALAHFWDERPGNPDASFNARGLSMAGGGAITAWLSAGAGLTFKDYVESGIEDTITGYAEGIMNLRDIVTLRLRRERTDELYNWYGIKQGIHADSWILNGHSFITRKLELNAIGRIQDYSDDNSGKQAYLNLAYSFTDHPRMIKGALLGEVRDTDEMTTYVYGEKNMLVDIVHPYWTPDDYQSWGAMLEWRHDISRVFTRGVDQRFYDLMVTLKDDTENNQTFEFKGEFRWEFRNRWVLAMEAALIRSGKWNAEGVWATARRYF